MNIKTFAVSSGILIISNVLLKAVNFFLLPVYTSHLTAEMLGISDTITTFTGLLFPIFMMGLDSAFSAFYYDNEKDQVKKVFHTILLTLTVVGCVPIIFCVFASQISWFLFKSNEYGIIVILSLLSVSFNIWYMPFALDLRMKNKMLLYSLVNVVSSIGMTILNIIFVVFLELGAISLILSTLIVHACQLLLFILVDKMKIERRYFEWDLLREMMKFAFPLVPGVILSWVLSLSDRYMLLFFHGVKEVGLYGVGTRLVTVLNIFISSVNMAYTTFAYGSKNDSNAKEKYIKVFDLLVLVLSMICYTAALFSKEIISFMTASEYYRSYTIIRDLMFAQLCYGVTSIVAYGVLFKKKSLYSLLANAIGAILNVVLNFILIPQWGINAAAFTTLAGYLVTFICMYIFAQKLYYCEYKVKKAIVLLSVLYGVSFLCRNNSIVNRIILWGMSIITIIFCYKDVLMDLWNIFLAGREQK